jgi:AraC-like DNA-binding protein/mannose-6-phosphate isomerase-like protein (cupin superfamily)
MIYFTEVGERGETALNPLFAEHRIPELKAIGVKKVEAGSSYCQPLHNHPGQVQLLLVSQGAGTVVIDGLRYEVAPQQMVIYDEGIWHEETFDSTEALVILHFTFSGLHFHQMPPGKFLDPALPRVVSLNNDFFILEQRFFDLQKQFKDVGLSNRWSVRYLLAALLAELSGILRDESPPRKKKSTHAAAAVKQYIQEHYSRNITLDTLSRMAFLSPFHLTRVFKAEYGMTPIHYLIQYRIEAAKQYLRGTRDSVERIAQLVGYESPTHFQYVFKQRVGQTPGQYREFDE